MEYYQRATSRQFREIVMGQLPHLQTCKECRAIAEYLFFCTNTGDDKHLLLPSATFAKLLGKERERNISHRKFALEDYFLHFQKRVNPTFQWSDAKPKKRMGSLVMINSRVRVVTNLEWSPAIQQAIQDEIHMRYLGERVYFTSGKKYTQRTYLAEVKKHKEEALQHLVEAQIPIAKDLLQLLNNTSNLPFQHMASHIAEAVLEADRIAKENSNEKEEMENQCKVLHGLYSNLQPFYAPTENSPRLFEDSYGLTYLDRRLRKVVTQGNWEIDLTSAQLAVNAKVWNVEEVQKFLARGGNMWEHLFEIYSIPKTDTAKQIFKTALYSLCYGAGKRRIQKDWIEACAIHSLDLPIAKFYRSPLIRALFRAREEQIAKILEARGAYNCFGQFIPVIELFSTNVVERKDFEAHKKHRVRSILAQCSQAYELLLLEPVIRVAIDCKEKSHKFTISLWQHDGFSAFASHPGEMESWLERLRVEVACRAIELGIETTLEVKQNAYMPHVKPTVVLYQDIVDTLGVSQFLHSAIPN